MWDVQHGRDVEDLQFSLKIGCLWEHSINISEVEALLLLVSLLTYHR